jgi:hypothetical protein
MSRIYGGIHYSFDNVAGKRTGALVANYVSANFLLPNNSLPLIRPDTVDAGLPRFRVHGHIGATVIVDSSDDLKVWRPVATNSAVSGGFLLRDSAAKDRAARFYRARE